jgi:radical SAM protein with 4Fe4S-binding SPASM domain
MAPHRLTHVSGAKLAALATTEVASVLGSTSLIGRPSVLQLEPTNVCDLRCPLCAAGAGAMNRKQGMMGLDIFRDIIREIGDSLSLLILWNWGEPFLNPNIFEMIAAAKERNVAAIASSNGQSLASPERADAVVASGLDTLAIAIDGATQESYAAYRVGGSLQKALDSFRLVREAKERAGRHLPVLNARVVVTKRNEFELPEIERLARESGAERLTFRACSIPSYAGKGLDSTYAATQAAYRMYNYDERGGRLAHPFVCRRPWKRLTVNWDGRMIPCEHDYSGTFSYGRFPQDGPLMHICNSAIAREFRTNFARDRNRYHFCAQCAFNNRVPEDCTVGKVQLR